MPAAVLAEHGPELKKNWGPVLLCGAGFLVITFTLRTHYLPSAVPLLPPPISMHAARRPWLQHPSVEQAHSARLLVCDPATTPETLTRTCSHPRQPQHILGTWSSLVYHIPSWSFPGSHHHTILGTNGQISGSQVKFLAYSSSVRRTTKQTLKPALLAEGHSKKPPHTAVCTICTTQKNACRKKSNPHQAFPFPGQRRGFVLSPPAKQTGY